MHQHGRHDLTQRFLEYQRSRSLALSLAQHGGTCGLLYDLVSRNFMMLHARPHLQAGEYLQCSTDARGSRSGLSVLLVLPSSMQVRQQANLKCCSSIQLLSA